MPWLPVLPFLQYPSPDRYRERVAIFTTDPSCFGYFVRSGLIQSQIQYVWRDAWRDGIDRCDTAE